MSNHNFEDFYNLACERFGEDKFTVESIQVTQESLDRFNKEHGSFVTADEVKSYRQVWLMKSICPKCGSNLGGLFGTFEWGIVHGCGHCSECGTSFQLYHYFGDCKIPIQAYALIGFK